MKVLLIEGPPSVRRGHPRGGRAMLNPIAAAASPRQLTSAISHELVSPLAAAVWYLAIAERHCAPPVPSEARAALAVARDQVEALHRLVARVIELETRGGLAVYPIEGDLLRVTALTIDRLTLGRRQAHAISVRGPVQVKGRWDTGVVEQIVRNLVVNAMKFGRGKPITVEVAAARQGAWIVVQDRGAGIAARDLRGIFERHACAPRAEGGGLGLGLWLVRELARAHGGKVTVRSRPGAGATFRVYLRSGGPERSHPILETARRALPAPCRRS